MIGKKIKELRDIKGITQEDLAKFLGVAPQTIYKYEKGINQPDLETTSKIADYFNITLDELLGRHEKMTVAASTQNGLDLADVSDETKKTIVDLYNFLKEKEKKEKENNGEWIY